MFAMTWWILSSIEFTCGFSVVAYLALIPYSFLIRSFLKVCPRNSFPWLYVIIVGRGYLHNHVCSTRFDIVAACFSFYSTISNHPVAGSIIFKDLRIRGQLWPSILILYGPIRSTNNLSRGMAYNSLGRNLPYLKFCLLFSDNSYKPLRGYLYRPLIDYSSSVDKWWPL